MPVQIEIISPEKVLVSCQVDMAVLPGIDGDLAAMPEHAPIMLLLRGGVVTLYKDDTIIDTYFVGGGFADITQNRCIVLADRATPVQNIDIDRATAELEALSQLWEKADKSDVTRLNILQNEILSVQAEIDAGSSS